MRIPLLIANWKMNHNVNETIKFATGLERNLDKIDEAIDLVVCPPFTSLYSLSVIISESAAFEIGAQNCHFETSGAFTGEISPAFLAEMNCRYVLVGHSERRQHFFETSEACEKKIKAIFKHDMSPVYCVGETLEQRQSQKTFDIISEQLTKGLNSVTIPNNEEAELVIAYEPVWAIGTGNNATPEQAEEVHTFIRHFIEKKWGQEQASKTRLLYGGSVKPDNIKVLMAKENIDGALIGGASLDVDLFFKMVKETISQTN